MANFKGDEGSIKYAGNAVSAVVSWNPAGAAFG